MTQLEFRRLRGEFWDQSFISSLGKTATKIYRSIYQENPKLRRSRVAKRNHVHVYPCGVLEQAYQLLREQAVPLVKPGSALARQLERETRELQMRDQPSSDEEVRDRANALRETIFRHLLSKGGRNQRP
jgi:hypothetical protein